MVSSPKLARCLEKTWRQASESDPLDYLDER